MRESRTEIAIAVVEDEGRFLVGVRPDGVALAGYCEFPGGKIQPGETPSAAAARECLEETGVEVDVSDVYPTIDYDYAHGGVRLHFLACRPRQPSPAPQTPFQWVERAQLASLRFPPANDAIIERLTRA